jgi:hypothetical protein
MASCANALAGCAKASRFVLPQLLVRGSRSLPE